MRRIPCAYLSAAVFTLAVLPGTGARGSTDRDGNPGPASEGLAGELVPVAAGVRGGAIVFTDKAAFFAAAGVLTTETFEDEPWSATCDSGAVALLMFQDFTVASQPPALKLLRDACFGNHNTTEGGRRYLGADTDTAEVSAIVTFAFAESLGAFGAYLVDLDDASLEVEVLGEAYPIPANGDGGESWFGILSDTAFAEVTLRVVAGGTDTHYSIDDVAHGPFAGGPVSAGWSVEPRAWGRVKSAYRR